MRKLYLLPQMQLTNPWLEQILFNSRSLESKTTITTTIFIEEEDDEKEEEGSGERTASARFAASSDGSQIVVSLETEGSTIAFKHGLGKRLT